MEATADEEGASIRLAAAVAPGLMTQDEVFSEFIRRFHAGEGSGPVPENEFLRLETELGVLFPRSFRRFEEQFGGAFTPGILVLVANEDAEDEAFDLQRISGPRELAAECEAAWSSGLPRDLVPIGRDSMGNFYCFQDLAGEGHRPDDAAVILYEVDFSQARHVSSSFTSLLEGFLRFR